MAAPVIHVWCDDPADGPTNMAADEVLAGESLRRGALLVRLYGWETTTISLGAFQKHEDALAAAEIEGLPLVRRPSGGGAIVHGSDLTYAAAVPKTHPWGSSPQALYDALHEALVRSLAGCGVDATLWRPSQPVSVHANDESFFCFDRRASGDVIFRPAHTAEPASSAAQAGRGHKIMGSAQRRLEGAVLQHGSLLLRRNTDVGGRAAHPGIADLAVAELVGAAALPGTGQLVDHWLALLAAESRADVVRESGVFRVLRSHEVAEQAARFREPRWTARR
ncbi:MAG: biotin/lipoate A/B protein ligase family protein [Planctomycetia bacterium]